MAESDQVDRRIKELREAIAERQMKRTAATTARESTRDPVKRAELSELVNGLDAEMDPLARELMALRATQSYEIAVTLHEDAANRAKSRIVAVVKDPNGKIVGSRDDLLIHAQSGADPAWSDMEIARQWGQSAGRSLAQEHCAKRYPGDTVETVYEGPFVVRVS